MRSTIRRAASAGLGAAAAVAAALALSVAAHAAPYRPVDDAAVLERLPPAVLALRAVRAQQAAAPGNLTGALAAANRYLEVGRTTGDPRAYGYAEAALEPWIGDAAPAPPLRVARARIRQFRHDFAGALAELEPALAAEPFDADAWLLFASIELVRGDVRAARAACLKLVPIADPLIGAACVASTAALDGRVAQGEALLARAVAQPTAASAGERAWSWTTLAELRARGGAAAAAEDAFRRALALSPDDVYTRAAFADFLLDQDRAGEVRSVLGGGDTAGARNLTDALLLRAAIAARRSGDADAAALAQSLAQRFAEARARGDATHLREQARFALDCEDDAPRALDLARRNFAVQREAADARVLLDAARAAADGPAERLARRWLDGSEPAATAAAATASREATP